MILKGALKLPLSKWPKASVGAVHMENSREAFSLRFTLFLLIVGLVLLVSGLIGSFSSDEWNQGAMGAGLGSLISAPVTIGVYLFFLSHLLSSKREIYLFALNVFSNSQRRKKGLQEAVLSIARNMSSAESEA